MAHTPESKLSSCFLSTQEHGLRRGRICTLEYRSNRHWRKVPDCSLTQCGMILRLTARVSGKHMPQIANSVVVVCPLSSKGPVGARFMHLRMSSLEVVLVLQNAISLTAEKYHRAWHTRGKQHASEYKVSSCGMHAKSTSTVVLMHTSSTI